jgi:hypothetical protein
MINFLLKNNDFGVILPRMGQVVLGRRKGFGRPKTQLAMFPCSHVQMNMSVLCEKGQLLFSFTRTNA